MRHCLIFLIVTFAAWPLHAMAEDVLVANVVSVNREQGSIIVKKITAGGKASPQETGGGISASEIRVSVDKNIFPGDLRPGAAIRIWGEFDRHSGGLIAKRIRSADYGGLLSDPTGVRRRLGDGCRMDPGQSGMNSHAGMGGMHGR